MATLQELEELRNNAVLFQKVRAQVIIEAAGINTEVATRTNHVNRLKWAKSVLENPARSSQGIFNLVLGGSGSSTFNAIRTASDAAIATLVQDAVDLFADGTI